ncbi:FicA antitoxin-like protein BiaA2 [Bartonella taylorii]|uniref:hypothetical protein n=1 Tax=Bartonella taylorii TaxID=33046 RepID=UPI000999B87A|nr:hypothetical protein [Bartonella taylorii]OPB35387.1 FicA antitoxin-like protein BiaA2 [Bartonella taylorii]
MIQQEKYGEKKFLIVTFVHVLTNANAFYEGPQKNQTINGNHNHDFHTLNTHQRAFENSFIKSKTLENTLICKNDKQWWKIHPKDFPTANSKRTKSTFKKEMCMTIIPKEHSASLASKELQKHHKAVEAGISTHTLEGISLPPKTLKISKEYAKGGLFTRRV